MMSSSVSPHIIISKVKDLCQRLDFFGIKVGDARKHPQISPVVILKSLSGYPLRSSITINKQLHYFLSYYYYRMDGKDIRH